MNIAFATQEYPPETAHGGIGTQTFAKAHWLAAHGHKIWVISHSLDRERHEYWQGEVRVIRVPACNGHWTIATEEVRWLTYSAVVAAELQQLQNSADLELVEFADWGCESYVHLLNRVPWNYLPTVIHLHGPVVMFAHALGWPDPSSRFFQVANEMERMSLRLADAVISSSRCSAKWVADHHGIDTQIPVLHTGIDIGLFRPLDLPKAHRPTIVFVGKIERSKGIELLVEAACVLASEIPDLHLRLIGRGNLELGDSLRRMADEAGFPELVELVGFVAREELPQHFARAHVFAGPSLYEGGPGFVYLEAMACGLPVIACSGSGASEVIQTGENGLLVPPNDVRALINALRDLLLDRSRCEELGRNAVRYVQREADERICLRRFEDFYAQFARITANN